MKRIISLTVLPSRLKNIKGTIDSLLSQDETPDEICVWLPKNAKRDNQPIGDIPGFLRRDPISMECVNDIGPATKLIPTLKKYWDEKETIIATADDDQVYPSGWFSGLLKYSGIYMNSCIGYRGRRFLRFGILRMTYSYKLAKVYLGHRVRKPKKVDIVTGNWGALYRVKFFDEEVFNLDSDSPMFFTDDIWFSGMISKNDITRYVVPMIGTVKPTDQHTVSSLWEINEAGKNNDWSIKSLSKYF